MKIKDMITYRSSRGGPPRWLCWLDGLFNLGIQPGRYEARAFTFAYLARHVTIQGVEPGYRAEQTKDNGGRGLDFYSLDPMQDGTVVAWSWVTAQQEQFFDQGQS